MSVKIRAQVQYGDMSGELALDTADFETLASILGIPEDLHLIGLSVWSTHPSLGIQGKTAATDTHTSLTTWNLSAATLQNEGDGQGIPGVIASISPIPVTEIHFATPDIAFGSSVDAIALLLRSAKRLNLTAWTRAIADSDLTEDDFRIVESRTLVRRDDQWEPED